MARIPCANSQSPLKHFIALPPESLLVVGPRRIPPLSSLPEPNTYTSLTILTANGWRQLEIQDYISSVFQLKPDIVVGPADLEIGQKDRSPGLKRKNKMDERTTAWMRAALRAAADGAKDGGNASQLWAPILPIEGELQRSYRELLEDTGPETLGGVVIYDDVSMLLIPPCLDKLPRLGLSDVHSPHAILRMVQLGIDILTAPFVNIATEAGIALDFKFPVSSPSLPCQLTSGSAEASERQPEKKLPLGYSLWRPSFASDLSPLVDGCSCFTCKNHQKAFIRHLLDAKEMLAWVLLQAHNHYQLDAFFSGIRSSLQSKTFTAERVQFGRKYTDQMPLDGGEGPRVRGYQIGGVGASPGKANPPARRRLERAKIEVAAASTLEIAGTKLDDQAQHLAEDLLDGYGSDERADARTTL